MIYRVNEDEEERECMKPIISSKKLRELGFEYKYGIEEIVDQTIDASIKIKFPTLNHKLRQWECEINNDWCFYQDCILQSQTNCLYSLYTFSLNTSEQLKW